jgi:serine/threonine protein kinase
VDPLPQLNAALAGRYALDREIGRGGMATLYLSVDHRHNRTGAIKVLREDLAASVGATRFLREIQIAAQLRHPNILPLLDSGDADGSGGDLFPYMWRKFGLGPIIGKRTWGGLVGHWTSPGR